MRDYEYDDCIDEEEEGHPSGGVSVDIRHIELAITAVFKAPVMILHMHNF